MTSKILTTNLTILSQINGKFAVHFGFFSLETEGYYCYERMYAVRPSLSLVNRHIREVNDLYQITDEEWRSNTGRVQN